MVFPPEAPCERIGSLMRIYWDSRRHLGPVDMQDLVFLSQAGVACTGSDRDELVVDEVMRLFEASAKNKKGVSSAVPPLCFRLFSALT